MKGTRREFLGQSAKIIASGAIGVSLFKDSVQAATAAGKKTAQTQKGTHSQTASQPKDLVEKRLLGSTGLKLSVISAGTAKTSARVIRHAMDMGINFIHISVDYSGGKSIKEVAKAIKGRRKKVYLGLKTTWNWDDDKSLNDALKTLGTNYVDIIFYPINKDPADPALVGSDKAKSTFERWKKQGKVRFLGLTTHKMMKEHMEAALKTGWYHCLMPSYQLNQRKEYLEIIKQCEKKKVGIIAMKTKVGEDTLDRVPVFLRDKSVTTINRTLDSFKRVDELIKASRRKVIHKQAKEILKVSAATSLGRCMMCGTCTSVCPQGLAVNDIVRCTDYYVDFLHDLEVARENYLEIAGNANAAGCVDCGTCQAACPNNVPTKFFVARAKSIFA